MGHQEQHLEFIDAAAAHMSAYDDNPRAQARAILRMDGADLRTRNEGAIGAKAPRRQGLFSLASTFDVTYAIITCLRF